MRRALTLTPHPLSLAVGCALTFTLTYMLSLGSARGEATTQAPHKPTPWRASLAYLSPRLSAGEGRHYSAHIASGEVRRSLWVSEAWEVGLSAHTLAWRGVINYTPTAEDFTPSSSTSSGEGATIGGITPLTPPSEVSEGLGWDCAGGGGLLLSRHSSSRGLTPSLTPSLTLGAGLSVLSSREARDPLSTSSWFSPWFSPWVSGALRWRGEEQGGVGLWLAGRWGGRGVGRVSAGAPLLSPLSTWGLSGGLSLGRAELGGGLEQFKGPQGERLGVSAGLSLPLSAPLYLVGGAWLDLEGGAEGRALSVGLRWTGERVAPELAPPKLTPSKPSENSRGAPQQGTRGPSLPQAPAVSPISPY